uniref:histidine kinase n=1 Tax=candidate division WOR-3 bacterium TaxID=2052148 RepID=A0A7C4GF00_UNCW3
MTTNASSVSDGLPDERLLAERLWTIGRMASCISGELRQCTSVVRNSAYFLNLHLGENIDDKTRRHLSILIRELRGVDLLISNLSALADQRPPDRQPADVELLVHAALSRLPIPTGIAVDIAVASGTQVFCDPEQLTCVLANLFTNSIQAMPAGGQLRVLGRVRHPEVTITVEDSGTGMDDETLRRAFEPLFSRTPQRLGIGLTVVRSLVGLNGGRVELTSTPGAGTTVALRFPSQVELLTEANQ